MPTDMHYENEAVRADLYEVRRVLGGSGNADIVSLAQRAVDERDKAEAMLNETMAQVAKLREQRNEAIGVGMELRKKNATLRRLLRAALAENRTWDSESAREADELLGEGDDV